MQVHTTCGCPLVGSGFENYVLRCVTAEASLDAGAHHVRNVPLGVGGRGGQVETLQPHPSILNPEP